MNLIIDIGNTIAKMAVFDGGRIVEVVYDSNLTLERLPEVCRTYTIEKAIVATVIDLSREVLSQLEDMAVPILWLNEKTSLPVENLYETPRTLGYDRMAAVVGANEQFPGRDILVIDAGTCITYEFVDAAARYHGGNISPGLQMRFKALHQFTGRLPMVALEGRMVPMKHKYPELLVFLTGGDDFSFDTNLKSIIFADRFLVLKGLNRILNYNNDRL